jgi:hypothetical protein
MSKRTNTHRRARRISRSLQLRGASDVRGYRGFAGIGEVPPVALVFGGLALLALLFSGRKGIVAAAGSAFDFAKAQAFKLALPSAVGRYAGEILNAAKRYDVDPFALAAIMWNESNGGTQLKPTGPAGTGDFVPRWSGSYFKYANPATGLPPDGLGWGRGLMQVDYGVHNAWVTGNNWRDAQTNINKAAEILRWNLDFFRRSPGGPVPVEAWRITTGKPANWILPWAQKYPRGGAWPTSVPDVRPLSGARLYEAAIAAYNVSYPAVQQALGLGLPAEAGTTRQDYVTKFLALMGTWQAKFNAAVG